MIMQGIQAPSKCRGWSNFGSGFSKGRPKMWHPSGLSGPLHCFIRSCSICALLITMHSLRTATDRARLLKVSVFVLDESIKQNGGPGLT